MTTSADKNLIQHDAGKNGKTNDAAAVLVQNVSVRDVAEQPDVQLSDSERLQMQQERLDAIRRAVESGAYDSEELLEKSIRLMMDRIDAEPDLQ